MFRKWIPKLIVDRKALGLGLLLCASLAPHAMAADLTAESSTPTVFFKDTSNPGINAWRLYASDTGGTGDDQAFFYLVDRYFNIPFHVHRAGVSGSNDNALVIYYNGYVGLGIDPPGRQLHMRGSNAVFRMDRPSDTAAFMLVRTDIAFTPLKTFVVGTNATAANNGEFVINDLGTADSGPGTRRMTIGNTGNVTFTGNVTALSFIPSSSERLKKDISTLTQARDAVEKLRGVRFAWKESGQASVGLIAEEVAKVFPELVSFENGQAQGVNYSALVAVLTEAFKEQQRELDAVKAQTREQLEAAENRQAAMVEALQDQKNEHQALRRQQQAEISAISARLVDLEQQLLGKRAMMELR